MLEVGLHLEEAARVEARPGQMALGKLVGLAHVDEFEAAAIGPIEQGSNLVG